jgi:hypothetical protein
MALQEMTLYKTILATTKYLEVMGEDILTGDVDKDHFNCGAGTDTITDFQLGVDTKTAKNENS